MDELAELLGESPTMQMVRDKLHRLLDRQRAGQRLPPILLQGETGTGKGLVARVLHRHSARSQGPFVDVNCAAIPETLLEAELFGFERGAFTDARSAKPGLFQAAHGGVLFLDEIGLLPESLQAKLLTAVEERHVRRLGSTRSEAVDVWLISATNSDLQAAVSARRFRSDLYHRLAVFTLDLPPLRDRERDVLLLARRFLDRACTEYGLSPKRLGPQVEAYLLEYSWPGNVRELANVIERAALFSDAPVVTADALGRFQAVASPLPSAETVMSRDEAMRRHLLAALEQTEWNISHTAARLGIARNTVYARMEKFGLRPDHPPNTSPGRSQPAASTPAPPAASHTGLNWERRTIALLRADLRGEETVDAWSKMSRALDEVIAKVQSFGGRLEEVTPTGLVAAFGIEPVEDAARRAAHAAMAIQRSAQRARARDGTPNEVTIGLHVAPLLIGRVGVRVEIDATGMRAAWSILEELLRGRTPGETVASRAAAPFLERRFDLARADATEDGREPIYRLTGQERRGLGLWGTMTRFVGRHDELDVLRRQLTMAQSGHGQVVAVVGEAGVGKSRLIHEFAHPYRPQGWRVLEGTSLSYGQTMSYLPVVDLLKQYFSIQDRDDQHDINEKIAGTVLALDASLQPTLPAFQALFDVPVDDSSWGKLDPAQRRQHTLDAVKRLLIRQAHEQTLVLIFEDLHWIDGETQAMLDILVDSLGSARLLLLVSYRPEYQHAWGSKTYYSQMRLDALPAESAAELLQALLGEDPGLAPLKQLLVRRGNPFFLEETVRTLVETNALAGERGRYRLIQPVQELQVPPTVQAVLATRIDRLPAEDKRLLQVASVVGKDIPFALLQAIAELPDEALRRGLDHLQAAEFLYETGLYPDVEYSFKHALTHEVTYGGLLHERRCQLHARIVEAIETLHGDRLDEQIECLAHHACRAEMRENAVDYLRRAGEKAMARSAHREAASYFEQAVLVLPHLPETRATREQAIDLRLALRSALHPCGELVRAMACVREAEALAVALGDRRRLGEASVSLSLHCYLMGAYDHAIAAKRALALAEADSEIIPHLLANLQLGLAFQAQGEYRQAIGCLSRTVAPLDGAKGHPRFGELIPAVFIPAYLAACHAELGTFAEGRSVGDAGLRIAEALDHPASLAFASWGIGLLALRQGDLSRAVSVLERAVNPCQDADRPAWFPLMAAALGAAYRLAGRIDDARLLLTKALEQTIATEVVVNQALCNLTLGEAQLLAGCPEEAHSLAERALSLARAHHERGNEAYALHLLGEIAMLRQPPKRAPAEVHYVQALALADTLGMRPLVAHCHFGLGKLYRRTGKHAKAHEHLTTATTMYREMDMHFWLEQAEAETRTGE